ncbi:glycosyl transferase [Leptospira ognonensis]|uniref:Glycosyl transferase n=1 Tax=Leptospira ognonensis TaxID=2484945 RepID=A0A4V3JQN7_9LEPT|nr:glycosyltransferase [Leptospira ognonensis]TGL56535.1 glycosyl transferase [Leptospira ognonensis]
MKNKKLCTLFDSNYLPLGLTLYSSLVEHFQDFHLWILALDDKCYSKLNELKLPNVTVLSLKDVEDEGVLVAKGNRTWQEYCWTLSPVLPSYVLEKNPEIDHIIYLDADLFFYSSPQPIFDEIANHSIMIIPHRFPERLKHLEVNGIFNVQMMFFRRDENGLACLKLWREQCLDWCYYISEPDRMGDQKYLDKWPSLYKNVLILKNIGAGVAMWNLEQYPLTEVGGQLRVAGTPLIFYHFHQYKYFSGGYFTCNFIVYNHDASYLAVYRKYVKRMNRMEKKYNLECKKLTLQETISTKMTNQDFHHYHKGFDMALLYLAKFVTRLLSNVFIHRVLRKVFKK